MLYAKQKNQKLAILFIQVQIILILALILLAGCTNEKELDNTTVEPLSTKVYTKKTAEYNPSKNAYFGDFHIHTSWSFDAFIYNVRTTPDDTYRYGKGEAIPHVSGNTIQMQRPLDFMAVTDHSEYMGGDDPNDRREQSTF